MILEPDIDVKFHADDSKAMPSKSHCIVRIGLEV